MWLGYHEQPSESGARIVHSCGFDSIPLRPRRPVHGRATARGRPDLGRRVHADERETSRVAPTSRRSRSSAACGRARSWRASGGEQEGRPGRPARPGRPGRPHPDEFAGGWVVPFPTIDPLTVLRSARALDRYGPDFPYSHYAVVGPLPMLVGLGAAAGVAAALAQIPPARDLLLKLKSSGEGPSEQTAREIVVPRPVRRAVALRRRRRGRRQHLRTEVSGGDPGYGETSKMLAESALCLAHDDLPEIAGQLTPAVAMGPALSRRLEAAGIEFKVLDRWQRPTGQPPTSPISGGGLRSSPAPTAGSGWSPRASWHAPARAWCSPAGAPRRAGRRDAITSAVPTRRCSRGCLDLADLDSVRAFAASAPRSPRPADQQRRRHGGASRGSPSRGSRASSPPIISAISRSPGCCSGSCWRRRRRGWSRCRA